MLRCFILFCLAALPVALNAQSYLNETAQWRFRGGSIGFDGTLTAMDHRYYLDGDTAIAGKQYFKVYFDRQDTSFNWISSTVIGYDTTLHTYVGAVREEGSRHYMVFFYSQEEDLIQDYDLETGDTLQWDYCYYPVIVTSIDTVMLGASPRRRFFLNNIPNEFVLEGAMSTDGFRVGCPGAIGLESNLDPVCFSQDGHVVAYQPGQASDCAVWEALQQGSHTHLPEVRAVCRVWPNPSSGFMHIDLPAGQNAPLLEVFDVSGRCVRSQLLSEQYIADLSGLPNGWYTLLVRTKDGVYCGKAALLR